MIDQCLKQYIELTYVNYRQESHQKSIYKLSHTQLSKEQDLLNQNSLLKVQNQHTYDEQGFNKCLE